MSDGVIYRHSVESFVERVLQRRGLLSPDFIRELKALGVDVEKPTEVDLATWARLVRATAAKLSPSKDIDAALEDVGLETIAGYLESLVGRSLFVLLRLFGPRRALLRMQENYHSADSITRIDARALSPTSVELVFNTTGGTPTYVRGLMLGTLIHLKVRSPQVTFEETGGRTVFTTSWGA